MRTKHEAVGFIKESALPEDLMHRIRDLYQENPAPKNARLFTPDLLTIRKTGASIPNHDDTDPKDWFEFSHDDILIDPSGNYLCFLHTTREDSALSNWVADEFLEYVQGTLIELPVSAPLPYAVFGKVVRLVRKDNAWAFIPEYYLADPDVITWRLLGG